MKELMDTSGGWDGGTQVEEWREGGAQMKERREGGTEVKEGGKVTSGGKKRRREERREQWDKWRKQCSDGHKFRLFRCLKSNKWKWKCLNEKEERVEAKRKRRQREKDAREGREIVGKDRTYQRSGEEHYH